MSRLKFSDGVTIDTDGPLRTLQLKDGWYVVGEGRLVPVKDEDEANKVLDSMILSMFEDDDEDEDDGGELIDNDYF